MLKSKEENPNGLYHKYDISKASGEPMDPNGEYFILRLDSGAKDPQHLSACRQAIHAYADAIAATNPALALDLRERYPLATLVPIPVESLTFEELVARFDIAQKLSSMKFTHIFESEIKRRLNLQFPYTAKPKID